MIDKRDLEYLSNQLAEGRVLLFAGAGFSAGARDLNGRELPASGTQVAAELWNLCYSGEAQDPGSSLQDLFDLALARYRGALTKYLEQRFTVDAGALPDYFRTWFSMPWARAYTLNVDDLEEATARGFDLPRGISSVSGLAGLTPLGRSNDRGALEVIHLNGIARAGPDAVTFSTSQYARRVGGTDPLLPQLVADLVSHPCIYVGTTLDEPPLWQHIELRGLRGPRELREMRRKSFLVSPSLSRARAMLLAEYNVHWIQATAREFAELVLEPLEASALRGLERISSASARATRDSGIPLVAELSTLAPLHPSEFLLGEEPSWSDITLGRAIERESDAELLGLAESALSSGPDGAPQSAWRVLLVSGTAGSGTSTGMKRLALRLTAKGEEVGWVDGEIDVSPRRLEQFPSESRARALFVDNAERYGGELASIVGTLATGNPAIRLLVLGMRAGHVERLLSGPRLKDIRLEEVSIPPLADSDISGLLEILSQNNLLGKLRGKSLEEQEQAFREQADRQLLVAMIQATSQDRFEHKIFEEWAELSSPEREAYGLVSLAYSMGHTLEKEQVLLASNDPGNSALNALEGLVRRHILRETAAGQVRARHRLIAEKLLEELLQQQKELVQHLYSRLAFVVAVRIRHGEQRSSRTWRMLKATINHERLFHVLDYVGARRIYEELESLLDWDYHYQLQRGSLELEYGQLRLAENYLEQALSLNDRDPRVITAYSYMLLKKAASNADALDSPGLATRAIDLLLDQISERGTRDSYPYHVMGSQGLAWSRRARLSDDERAKLVGMLVKHVSEGVRNHPHRRELQQLLADLKKEDLSRALRR